MKIFHHNDMDGYTSAAVMLNSIGACMNTELFCVNYESDVEEKFNKVEDKEKVIIVDYSFTEDTCHILQKLIDKKCKIVWIDHHDSSIQLENKHTEFKVLRGIRSKDHSGAALAYMFIHNCEYEKVPYFIKLVSDYDTFQRNMIPESDYFKLYYDAQPDKFYYLNTLLSVKDMIDNKMIKEAINNGKIIKDYIDQEYKSYRNGYGFESELEGIKVFVINRSCNSWIFGEKYDEYPMVCVFAFDGKEYKYSLFSSDSTVDCSKIAEKFGGGGHKGAAGFRSKKNLFDK